MVNKKIRTLAGLCFLFVSIYLSTFYCGNKKADKPNIVLIIIDTLRADKLGCYGDTKNSSPEIDRLSKKGVLFERVLAPCSWARPSIGAIITGLNPRTLGIYKEKFDILHNRYLTLAEVLKANGYSTFGVTANPNINKLFNFEQGFKEYVDTDVVWKWMRPLENKKVYDGIQARLPTSTEVFKQAIRMAKTKRKGPGYIQLNVMEVHERKLLTRPEFGEHFKNVKAQWYYAAIRQISYDTKNFIDRLSQIPGWENTLFVITSDHGESLYGEHINVAYSKKEHKDTPSHGGLLYGSQVEVPLIFYKTGEKKLTSRRISSAVRLIDVMPSILDFAKLSIPRGLAGKSIMGLVKGDGEAELPKYFVAETRWRESRKIGVYSSKWEYIENKDKQKGTDPYELQDRNIDENGKFTNKINEYQEVAKEMKEFLKTWESKYKEVSSTSPNKNISSKKIKGLIL